MRRLPAAMAASILTCALVAAPAVACGGLIGPNGAVNLLRTTTFVGYQHQRTWMSGLSWISVRNFIPWSLKVAVPGVHVVDQDGEEDGVVFLRPAEAFVARHDADEGRPVDPVDLGPLLVLDQLEPQGLLVETSRVFQVAVVEEGDL